MQDYVARLIDCGMPRLTAVFICRHYLRLGQKLELEKYIEAVEAETRAMEDV